MILVLIGLSLELVWVNVQVVTGRIPTLQGRTDHWLQSNQSILHGYCCWLHRILHFAADSLSTQQKLMLIGRYLVKKADWPWRYS